jgi:putative heme-binding domain-containing protein
MLSYESDALGAKYRGMIVNCEAARNVLFGYLPQPEGAGFKLRRFDLLTTNREQKLGGVDSLAGKVSNDLKTWFRPSDAVVGPDGAIYVADWFDPRVGGHQDLDKGMRGAIYRIAPKGFKSVVPQFDLATTAGQITALKSPAVNVRSLGFLRLKAQGAAAVAPVAALLGDENPFIRARAVWLLALLGSEGVARVESLLGSADAAMRVTAFRTLRRIDHQVLAHAAQLAGDPSPAVRREVAVALRDVPLGQSRDLLLTLARGYDGQDRSYLEAWGIGCTGKEAEVFAALAANQPEQNPLRWSVAYAKLAWRLTPVAAAGDFAARAASDTLPEADRLAAVTALGFMPTREAAFALLNLAEKSAEPVKTTALWWLLDYRSTRWSKLAVDEEFKTRGLYDPAKVVVTEITVPPASATKLPPAAAIAALNGNAKHGSELAQSCRLCHRVGEQGVDYAPSLASIGTRQATEALITSIIDPSADIAHGFEGTEVTLKDGRVVQGLVQSRGDPLVIQSTGGTTQMIPTSLIKTRRGMSRSLMLSAEQLGLSAQDVADVVAYLKTQ